MQQASAKAATLTMPSPEVRSTPRGLEPPLWFGADLPTLVRLWARYRFAIHPALAHVAAMNLAIAAGNSFFGALQQLVFGRRVARTKIEHDPVFILGHWRSGTTLLHELLASDPQFTAPTNLACFAPHSFLLLDRFAERWFSWLLPSQRSMDRMPVSWSSPQEDEFALCNRGVGSQYCAMAFPNRPSQYAEYLELELLPEPELRRWQRQLEWFLKQLTFRNPRRLVLKSPPHTCRIGILLEMFPDARFIHIVRNPYDVYFSTIKLWTHLTGRHAFQKPKFRGLREKVFETYLKMHRKLDETRSLIRRGRFHQLRFEDLIADPLGQLRETYRQLELENFDAAVPAVQRYLEARADHRPQTYPMLPEERQEIAARWGEFFTKYGYPLDEPGS